MSFIAELKRRNVVRVGVAYTVVGWLLAQVAEFAFENFGAPDWVLKTFIVVVLLGLPLALFFAWAFELTPHGLKRQSEVVHVDSIIRAKGRRLDFIIIGLLAVALGYFIWESRYRATEESPDTVAIADSMEKSIAVLPFVNLSNDPEQEYFSDGIAAELLNVLGQYPNLLVAARTSSFQFKGQFPDIADIADKLHVNHVLEGTIRKAGTRVRITAQLIETDTGFRLWSETFDREIDDVFAIQDEISAAIGEALKVQMALGDGIGKRAPTVRAAASVAAFDSYIRGRQLINLRSRKNLEAAVTYLERSLALDSTYAPAHAQMAIAISLLSNSSYGDLTLEESTSRATPHIDRALALDDRLPEAFAARALLALQSGDYDITIENANRALELNPSYNNAINWLNLGYLRSGRYSEYEDNLKRLLRVDPLSFIGRFNLAFLLTLQRDYSAAHALADSISTQNPQFGLFTHGVVLYDGSGDLAESLIWFLRAIALDQENPVMARYISYIYGQLDMFPEAQRLNEDLQNWALLGSRRWPELIADYRQKLANDPSNLSSKIHLADALHLSGDLEQAQLLYEDIISRNPHVVIFNPDFPTVAPMARAALGRLRSGNIEGATYLVELTTENQRQRRLAGWQSGRYFRTDAILAAIDGNTEKALENIGRAIDEGLRDRGIFSEPAFDSFNESPEFLTLQSQLDSIINAEREKALQMMCFDNPVPDAWQPLPATCDGVEATP